MTPKLCLLVNPTAGKGRAAQVVSTVTERLAAAGVDVTVEAGDDAADAARRARSAVEAGCDALVAVGGDGMVNLAVNAVAGTAVSLGIIAAGTGNDFAAVTGLPVGDPGSAADRIAACLHNGTTRAIDAVRAGSGWFANVLGAGFDSRVTDRANRMSWPRGPMRYNLAMLAELRVFHPLPFTITADDDETWQTDAMLVAVGNGRSYGAGMRICPDADPSDGWLDLTVIGPVSKPELIRTFPKVYRGTHVDHPAITTRRARTITIDSPGITAYADGERFAPLPVTCECVAGALRLLG